MQIIFHLGVHCTDDDRLLRSLLRNRGRLAEAGTVVPGPGRYRQVIRDALKGLNGDPPGQELRDFLMDSILDDDRASRVILSGENFLAGLPRAVAEGVFYPGGPDRAAELARFFPRADLGFFLGLRNPATFLPAVQSRIEGLSWRDFIPGCDPLYLRWSDFILRLQNANPGVPLTIWCNEDTPLIWPEILSALAGLPDGSLPHGEHDLVATLMSEAGLRRMRAWMEQRPPRTAAARRKVVSAFLDKYALPGALEEELPLPGWTADYVDAVSAAYAEDVDRIASMPGVTFLSP